MSYSLRFSEKATEDIKKHKQAGNKIVVAKITTLLEDIAKNPFTETGKPEPLRHELSGCWSRRINKEHRLVYEVADGVILILSAKGHYK